MKYSYQTLIENRDYEAALQSVFEHIEVAPDNVDHYINGAILLQKFSELEKAEVFLQRAITIDENSFLAMYTLGNLYYENNRFEEAIKIYLHAYSSNPTDSDLNYMIAMCYINMNQQKMALPFFETAYQSNRHDIDIMMQYGLACCHLELYTQGKVLFTTINDIEANADAYYNLGLIAMMEDDEQRAHSYFEHAVKLQPDHYLALNGLKNLQDKE